MQTILLPLLRPTVSVVHLSSLSAPRICQLGRCCQPDSTRRSQVWKEGSECHRFKCGRVGGLDCPTYAQWVWRRGGEIKQETTLVRYMPICPLPFSPSDYSYSTSDSDIYRRPAAEAIALSVNHHGAGWQADFIVRSAGRRTRCYQCIPDAGTDG